MTTPGSEVPFIGPRSRYSVVGNHNSLVLHRMASGVNMTGVRPDTMPALAADDLDPAVSAGLAVWSGLTHGGLFRFSSLKRGLVVEGFHAKNGVFTATIVRADGHEDTMPTEFPFKLSIGEDIKVTSTGAGADPAFAEYGVIVRLDVEPII